MKLPQAYLCFDLAQDEPNRAAFVEALETQTTAFTAPHWSMKGHSDQVEWQKQVRDSISICDLVIVLVGAGTAAAANVQREIALARERNVPFFGVYVGGADASVAAPAGLAANRCIPLAWPRIDEAVTQVMGEGKNHVFQ